MQRIVTLTLLLTLSFFSCTSTPGKDGNPLLNPHAFKAKIQEVKEKNVLDVRTPGEFQSGFITGAVNIDWYGSNFAQEVAKMDKKTPVFVYCAAGGRSHSAFNKLKEMGFEEVYELQGGMRNWQAQGMEVTTETNAQESGMSMKDYHKMLEDDKLVLVDFYATWCSPCKKMDPFLKEIAKEKQDKLTLQKIDADKNTTVANELRITGLPTVLLYKNKKLVWSHMGYIGKIELLEKISNFE